MVETKVADIVTGGRDSTGARIETVYAKVVPKYAVYRTAERVVVQYADDPELSKDQRQALIGSNPLKGEINGLIDGWRRSPRESAVTRARLFDRRVADALVVALQGDQAHALDLLTQTKADLIAERTSIARTSYLFTACGATVIFAMLFGRLHTDALSAASPPAWLAGAVASGVAAPAVFKAGMYLSAAVGALGAFFSIAMAIRSRQIGTDLQWRDNHADAALRVVIGVISGAALYCLLYAKVVTISLGGPDLSTASDKAPAGTLTALNLVFAFAAGFTERLVGDLLGRVVLGNATSNANPLAGTTGLGTPAATPPKALATESNPLGKPAAVAAGVVTGATTLAAAAGPPDADEHAEGCLDHVALGPDELTRDVELPEATGGVAGRS